jgi:hypothetical protein
MLSKWRHYGWSFSLLLCVATVVLWVRSYWTWDRITFCGESGSRRSEWAVKSCTGWIVPSLFAEPRIVAGAGLGWSYEACNDSSVGWPIVDQDGVFAGFGLIQLPPPPPQRRTLSLTMVAIPDWFLCLTLLILPAARVLRVRWLARHRSDGFCPSCTYNLTGNSSGICPECGTTLTISN